MAIIKNGYLRGQVGDLVNRKVGDLHVVQTKPNDEINQTRWTKAAANDFGEASTIGALIRRAFINCHQKMYDKNMPNRLIKQIQRAMYGYGKKNLGCMSLEDGNIQRLVNFQFNENCHLQDYLYFDLTVSMDDDRILQVDIPALPPDRLLKIPLRCNLIRIQIDVVGFDFKSKKRVYFKTQDVEIKLHGQEETVPEQSLFFECDQASKQIIVCCSLLYLTDTDKHTYLHNHKKLHPTAIIGAFNPDSALGI